MWITNFAIETNKPFSKLLRNSSGGMLHHSNLGGGRDTWVPVHLASTSICIRIMIRKLVIIVTMKIKWLWGRTPPPYEAWYQFSGLSEHCKARKKTWKYIAMTCLIYITLLDKSWQYTFKSFFSLCSARINLKIGIRLHKGMAYVPIIFSIFIVTIITNFRIIIRIQIPVVLVSSVNLCH